MRVTLLNQYYWPDIAATAQLLGDLGAALAARGHAVRAVACARPYAPRAGEPSWRPLRERHRGVDVLRVPTSAWGRGANGLRALDYAGFVAGALPLLLATRPEVVVALSTPPLVAGLGLAAKRLVGARLVYWVMDVYPDVAFELGALPRGGRAARALAGVNRALFAGADSVIALDDAMALRLRAAGCAPDKLVVIDNWAPSLDGVDHVAPRAQASALRRELGIDEDALVVGYAGNLGRGHDLATVAALVEASLAALPRVRWIFVGDGPERARVAALAARHAGRVWLRPYCALEALPATLAAFDVSLVSLDAALAGLLAPSKLYSSLAAGLPVLYVGPPAGRTAELVRDAGIGLAVDNGDVAGGVRALARLGDDRALRRDLAAQSLAAAARFSRPRALAAHVDNIERVAR